MSDDTSTDELDGTVEETTALPTKEPATDSAEPAAGNDPAASDEKPKRTVGLRKPTGRERGAMAATAMAAVPATGVIGSIVYGNFGPAGLAATAATGLAAGGVALAVRAKRRAEERAKGKDAKPGLPPHTLGGLKGLLAGAKEKAAARRQQMAERRAGRQGRGPNGGGGPGGVAGRVRAALGRGAGGAGRASGTSRTPGATPPRGRHAVTGEPAAGRPVAGKPAAAGGRHATPGGRPVGGRAGSKVAGRSAGGSRRGSGGPPSAGSRGGAGRYVNPATGRPMSPGQVSRAIRQQQRAQRVVSGNSYPRKLGRWAARHPKAVGIAAAGIGGVAAAVMFAPLAAAAGIGLGVFGAARHPAFRNAAVIAGRGIGRHTTRGWRWMRGQWLAWRRRKTPLEGDIVDDPPVTPPEPDIVDAEIVPEPEPVEELPASPRPAPASKAPRGPFAPPRRQAAALSNRPALPEPILENHMRVFDTLTETIAGLPGLELGRGEGGGHDIDRWAESLADFFDRLGERINNDASSIAERYPMDSSSQESMGQLGTAIGAFASQVREHVDQWKSDTSWQYTDNNA